MGARPVERVPLPESAFQQRGLLGAKLVGTDQLLLDSSLLLLDLSTGAATPFIQEIPLDFGMPAYAVGRVGADGLRYVLYGIQHARTIAVLVQADSQGRPLTRWTFPLEVFDFDVDADGTVYLAGPADDGYVVHAYRQGRLLWRAVAMDAAGRTALEQGAWFRWFHVQARGAGIIVVFRDRGWTLDRSGRVQSAWVFQGLGPEDFIDQLVPQSDGGFAALVIRMVYPTDATPIPLETQVGRTVRVVRGVVRMEPGLVRFGPTGQRLSEVGLPEVIERLGLPADAWWAPIALRGDQVLLVSRVRREALWVKVPCALCGP